MADRNDIAGRMKEHTAKSLALMESLMTWDKVDLTSPKEVERRCMDYYQLMAQHNIRPLVSGLAMALGIDRRRLHEVVNGYVTSNPCTHIPQECKDIIKKAYDYLEINWELTFTEGKINPVAGIFMAKNNYGYKDQTEVVVEPKNPLGDAQSQEEIEKRLLSSVVV